MHRALLLYSLLLAMSVCVVECVKQSAVPHQIFLYPIMKNGLNNQKRDLRNALALAKALDVGIVMPGFFMHYKENRRGNSTQQKPPPGERQCFKDTRGKWKYMNFNRVVDKQPIESWINAASVKELRAAKWDGKLDAMIYPTGQMASSEHYMNRSLWYEGVELRDNATHLTTPVSLHCDAEQLKRLKDSISNFRVVGLLMTLLGDGLTVDARRIALEAPKQGCYNVIHEANGLLRSSSWIANIAARYTAEVLGTGPYLAVHIRPYPDHCIAEWQSGQDNPNAINSKPCIKQHRNLHQRIGPCIAKFMSRRKMSNVFIMTHPAIQATVGNLLQKAGIRDPSFIDTSRVLSIAGCQSDSVTFLSMVEEEISSQAHAFIGTSYSSITHSIAFTRASTAGSRAIRDHYFESMSC